jgi:hypothetical protein
MREGSPVTGAAQDAEGIGRGYQYIYRSKSSRQQQAAAGSSRQETGSAGEEARGLLAGLLPRHGWENQIQQVGAVRDGIHHQLGRHV